MLFSQYIPSKPVDNDTITKTVNGDAIMQLSQGQAIQIRNIKDILPIRFQELPFTLTDRMSG